MSDPARGSVTQSADSTITAVRLTDVRKSFGPVQALSGVSLDLREGETHALLGENGAGKTTLMNVLYGLVRPDSGSIELAGRSAKLNSPSDAIRAGIGMVHQHFMLVPNLTVAENVLIGDRSRNPFWFRRRQAQEVTGELAERFGLELEVDRETGSLPVGLQQRVEILKCLARDARVLILDEPTAVLTPQEVDDLGVTLRHLQDAGTSIIFISHKLTEVVSLCDRVTVLRRGKNVGTVTTHDVDERALGEMMLGRVQVRRDVQRRRGISDEPVLDLEHLTVNDDRRVPAVRDVSLQVPAGQIYGLAGIDGNGQQELVEAIAGTRRVVSGRIRVGARDLTTASPRRRADEGLALITDDRQNKGLVMDFSVAENLALRSYRRPPHSRRSWLHLGAIRESAAARVEAYSIVAPHVQSPVSELSGGNQQKVVIARELGGVHRVLVAVNPTRGLDVGAMEYVHDVLLRARDDGRAVVLISTELNEILDLSDRVGVLFRGILTEIPAEDVSASMIGRLMLGLMPHVGDVA